MWDFIAKIGVYFLDAFISDQLKKLRLKSSWLQFIQNRQTRANATVELKENFDQQTVDLDQYRKKLEEEKK